MSDAPDRKAATLPSRSDLFGPILRHPLTATVIAFVLTGILGTYFTKLLDERATDRREREETRDRAIQSVREITDLLYERRTRSEMLVSSIRRRADTSEIKSRKQAYDDLYVRWNSRLQSNLFRVREITAHDNSTRYSQFKALQEQYLAPLLRQADSCVTQAYDLAISPHPDAHDRAQAVLEQCRSRDLHGRLLDCSYAFTNGLFVLIRSEVRNVQVSDELVRNAVQRCAEGRQSPPAVIAP